MKVCKIAGCGGRVIARGWCRRHYKRWKRHGDPLAGRTPEGDCLRFLEENKDYAGTECLLWPYGKDGHGYGRVWQGGRHRQAHAVMLELVSGPPPTPEHEAAHACGQGHKGCVSPQHLRWATPSENQGDRLLHGTHNRGERNSRAKLTAEQVLEILALLKQGVTQKEIGGLYGVARYTVSDIKRGRCWAWLNEESTQ